MELKELLKAYSKCYDATSGDADAAVGLLELWLDSLPGKVNESWTVKQPTESVISP